MKNVQGGKKLWFNGVLALTALGGMMLVTAPSAATGYPGIQCRRVSGGTYGVWNGTITNTSSTSDMIVHCPFDNDSASASGGHYLEGGSIKITNRHDTVDYLCSFCAEVADGSTVTRVCETEVSGTASASFQTLSFSDDLYGFGSYHYAECIIPRTQSGNVSHLIQLGHQDE